MNLSVGSLLECKTLFDAYSYFLFMKNKVVDSQNKVADWITLIGEAFRVCWLLGACVRGKRWILRTDNSSSQHRGRPRCLGNQSLTALNIQHLEQPLETMNCTDILTA